MTQTYNELLKHPLVNVSKELTPPKPVHPVHDELCQREIKVKVNTLNSLFQIFHVTLTILQLYHSSSMATHCEKKMHFKFFKVRCWKAWIIPNDRKSNFKQRYLCLHYSLLSFLLSFQENASNPIICQNLWINKSSFFCGLFYLTDSKTVIKT